MPVFGLSASHGHVENGMIRSDMRACVKAADKLDEVIIFRSTGPWSKRWIQRGYPTKNFHVKGKSSDWGPQAGFVPHLGQYSKVGDNADKAAKGTAANDHGIKDGYAARAQLVLSQEEIQMQLTLACEHPPRTALSRVERVLGSHSDQLLWASMSSGARPTVFRAVKNGKGLFAIHVVENCSGGETIGTLSNKPFVPLEVMTSSENGADNRPMTGDYDLMAVCPRWANYGSALIGSVSKPGLQFGNRQQPGQTFHQGTNLDKVLDMSSNTGQKGQNAKRKGFASDEHPDMGNITPRILRAINTLNDFMGGQGPFRRVHHNAESHRNAAFGALSAKEMEDGDGLPLTVFQPAGLWQSSAALRPYQDVSTLLTLKEFRTYAALLNEAGYFVPRNWTWGMSIRDRA
ncbi:MAG: anthrax toxin-like adenylyl cyclase domain-containing protein [Rubrivivax sp.]